MYDAWLALSIRYSYKPADCELQFAMEAARHRLLSEIPVPAPSTFEQASRVTRAGHLFSWCMRGWSSHAARMASLGLRQNATGY